MGIAESVGNAKVNEVIASQSTGAGMRLQGLTRKQKIIKNLDFKSTRVLKIGLKNERGHLF